MSTKRVAKGVMCQRICHRGPASTTTIARGNAAVCCRRSRIIYANWSDSNPAKKPKPTAAILDSQTIKSSESSGERGYAAGKKINGRKRPLLVDTMGLILMVLVLPANVQDREGARQLLQRCSGIYKALRLIWADGGYAGQLITWVKGHLGCRLEIVKRPDHLRGFKVLPRRWVVERTFGWFGRYRRLNRDYERLATSGEVMVYLAMTRLMLRRLTK